VAKDAEAERSGLIHVVIIGRAGPRPARRDPGPGTRARAGTTRRAAGRLGWAGLESWAGGSAGKRPYVGRSRLAWNGV
jgi:hypothetical protein